MTFNNGGKSFPIIYHNGESGFNLGILTVSPTMNIKNTLSILSHKIGMSPHQFSVFIAHKRTNRKILFTANINLATVSPDGGAVYIYVRRYRRFKKNLSEKLMHLRRDGAVDRKKFNGSQPVYAVPPSVFDPAEFQRRLRNLHKKGDPAFLMRWNAIAYLAKGVQMGNGGGSRGEGGRAVCKECLKMEVADTDAGFHLCVRDEVVVGFKTTARPISRPAISAGKVCSGDYVH